MRRYVVGFCFSGDGVYLIKKNKPSFMAGKYNGIGGKVEEGEEPVDAMSREFNEEAGLVIPVRDWEHYATLEGVELDDTPFYVFFYRTAPMLSHRKDELPRQMEDEPVDWIRLDCIRFGITREQFIDVVPNVRWLLQMAHRDQKHDWPFHIRERYSR